MTVSGVISTVTGSTAGPEAGNTAREGAQAKAEAFRGRLTVSRDRPCRRTGLPSARMSEPPDDRRSSGLRCLGRRNA
jgi:hypothetical protein